MRIQTTADLESAIARLSRRSPKSLAAFIASLAHDSGPIGEHVRGFIDADDPLAIVVSLQERIGALRQSNRRNSRNRASEDVGERFGYLVDAIETTILRSDPRTAFRLLAELIERDGDGMETCEDEGNSITTVIGRACALLARAAPSQPTEEVLVTLKRLVAGDAYGTRSSLTALVGKITAGR
jgi:hypothetical protein